MTTTEAPTQGTPVNTPTPPSRLGFVIMLSGQNPPAPKEELAALAEECAAKGQAHLLLNRTISPQHYERGQTRVAIIEAGSHQVLALARYDGVLDHETNRGLGVALYDIAKPPLPKIWLRLAKLDVLDPPRPLESLGWVIKRYGVPLTSHSLPRGQAAMYFQVLTD